MMLKLPTAIAALALALVPFQTAAKQASDPKVEILSAVQSWLDAFEAKDAARLAALTHKDGMQFSARYLPGQEPIRVRTNREDLESAGNPGPRFTERFWNPTVLVRADLAQFWAPYSFDIDGKRSHCGIDNFTLMRIDGHWVMTNASWTVEPPERCASLGEPGK